MRGRWAVWFGLVHWRGLVHKKRRGMGSSIYWFKEGLGEGGTDGSVRFGLREKGGSI